jgi:spermidine/putrescine-binding protein
MDHFFVLRGLTRLGAIFVWIFIIVACLHFGGYFKEHFSEKSLNILVWPQVLDAEFLKEFEKKAGVKVRVSYFDHNE